LLAILAYTSKFLKLTTTTLQGPLVENAKNGRRALSPNSRNSQKKSPKKALKKADFSKADFGMSFSFAF